MAVKWVGRVMMILVFVAIFMAGFGSAVLYLWNWLMPPLFGLHTITYWQALGLLGLSWLLFGGWRGRGMPGWGHSGSGRWGKMTPEEREKFREGMRARCGFGAEKTNA